MKHLKGWGIWPNSQHYAHQIVYDSSWGRALLQKRTGSFWWISCGIWKRRLWDQGRTETQAWLVLPLARTSTVLCLSQKSPDVSCLWNGKKKNSCLVSPLLSKKLGVNFFKAGEREENIQRTHVGKTHTWVSPCGWGFLTAWHLGPRARIPRDRWVELTLHFMI